MEPHILKWNGTNYSIIFDKNGEPSIFRDTSPYDCIARGMEESLSMIDAIKAESKGEVKILYDPETNKAVFVKACPRCGGATVRLSDSEGESQNLCIICGWRTPRLIDDHPLKEIGIDKLEIIVDGEKTELKDNREVE